MSDYLHGQFCWIELTANNWQQAKEFYSNLFGWHAVDSPIGDDMYYTMMQIDGKTVAAMYQMTSEQAEQGSKTNWLSYVSVDNVDQTCTLAQELSAQVIAGPHDVMDAGRMAMIHEPNGAVFAIWQANQNTGLELRDSDNTLCWNELASKNGQDSQTFYQQLFNWQCIENNMDGVKYTELVVGDKPQAGIMEMTDEWGDMPPHWMTYFQVADCDKMADKAQQLGATICVPPTSIPDVGRFCVINDVQGATFSIITLLPK